VGGYESGREDQLARLGEDGGERIPGQGGRNCEKQPRRRVGAQDVDFKSDSTRSKVERLLKKAMFMNGGYEYERRKLRIIIQEQLYPLKALTNVKDIAQVLLDVGCGMWFDSVFVYQTLKLVQFTDGSTCVLESCTGT